MRPGPRDDLLGARQGAHRLRDAVQRRGPTLLLAFALLPGLPEILGNLTAAEDVGMPANQLVGDPPGDVVEGEAPLVLGYLGVEVDLKQQVAKLLQKVGVGSLLDGVDHLAGLLDEVGQQRLVGLFPVPGTFDAQPGHHLAEADQLLTGHGHQSSVATEMEPPCGSSPCSGSQLP